MLVLSRRPDEQFDFPGLGIHVKVLGVRGNVVKIGVQAPREIQVVRGELATELAPASGQQTDEVRFLTRKQLHDLKNQLNALNLAARLLQRQRDAGMFSAADGTMAKLLDQLETFRAAFAPAPVSAQEGSAAAKCRTLLVEDDNNERELLAGFLRMSGYDVDTACDGQEALDYLESQSSCGLVLLDMCMPRLDGRRTIQSIRCNPKLSALKVFAVSGSEPSAYGVETGPKGVDRWFSKPLDPEQLVREMSQAASALLSA